MKLLEGMLVASILAVAACDTGVAGDDMTGDDQDSITCSASLSLAGTFVQSDPLPPGRSGCWPIGTWTFTATVVDNTCPNAPDSLPSYVFVGSRDLSATDPDYTWLFDVTTPSDNVDSFAWAGVSAGGVGLCEGMVMTYSADGKNVWNMHPELYADNTLSGNGDYEVHTSDIRHQQ
jgi:hypothetical protein